MSGRQSTKHIAYCELLDAVRNAAGCPLCDIEANSMKRYFGSLLHESVNDPGVREELIRSQGYCQRHAHYLRAHGGGLGIAILYQDQIKLFLRLLEGLPTISTTAARKGTRIQWQRHEGCPACRTQNDCRSRYGTTLIEWLHDQEMRAALDASVGSAFRTFWRCWICR